MTLALDGVAIGVGLLVFLTYGLALIFFAVQISRSRRTGSPVSGWWILALILGPIGWVAWYLVTEFPKKEAT